MAIKQLSRVNVQDVQKCTCVKGGSCLKMGRMYRNVQVLMEVQDIFKLKYFIYNLGVNWSGTEKI